MKRFWVPTALIILAWYVVTCSGENVVGPIVKRSECQDWAKVWHRMEPRRVLKACHWEKS